MNPYDRSSIRKIFDQEIRSSYVENDLNSDMLARSMVPSFKSVAQKFFKTRNAHRTHKRPRTIDQIDFSVQKNIIFDITFDAKRIIAYSSQPLLEILSGSERWQIDGTWKPSNLFEQLFIIGTLRNNEFYACVFIFFESKKETD